MSFEVSCVDRKRFVVRCFSSKPFHDPGKHPYVTPPFPTIVERLGGAVFIERITSAQAIAIDEDNATKDMSIINARYAMALWKIGPKPRHLIFVQPAKIAHKVPQIEGYETLSHLSLK
ncbi:hypothetical protein KMP13_16510 [Epibacterium ulvae]|nr:hypothetical protein [Epibacterium ulvae]